MAIQTLLKLENGSEIRTFDQIQVLRDGAWMASQVIRTKGAAQIAVNVVKGIPEGFRIFRPRWNEVVRIH